MTLPTFVEPLESRIAPAAVYSFIDVDGDAVTIKTSKGTDAQLDAIITAKTVGNAKVIQEIDFSLFGNAGLSGFFEGTDLTIIAVKKTPQGDGAVHIGYIDGSIANGSAANDGSAYHLGKVVIDGDVGQIDAGIPGGTPSIKSLTIGSLGRYGILNQRMDNKQTVSTILGSVGSLTIRGDMVNTTLNVGSATSVTVLGSIINSSLAVSDSLGTAKVGGELSASTLQAGTLGNLTVAGSVFASRIKATTNAKNILIGGNLEGILADDTGTIFSSGSIGGLTIKGSILSPYFNDFASISHSGFVTATGDIGAIKILGDIRGGNTSNRMGGGGGISEFCGGIAAGGRIKSLFIGGSLVAGSDDSFGGTNFYNGAIEAVREIGPVTILGSMAGTFGGHATLYAGGPDAPTGTKFTAIASITIKGRVEYAEIAAGRVGSIVATETNKDAQIGSVSVRGDWIASSLLAGTSATGEDRSGIYSRIASVKIGGYVDGEPLSLASKFRFAAQEIASFTVGGVKQALTPGRGNDLTEIFLGSTATSGIVELPA